MFICGSQVCQPFLYEHLSYVTIIGGSIGKSHKTGLTVVYFCTTVQESRFSYPVVRMLDLPVQPNVAGLNLTSAMEMFHDAIWIVL